MSSSCHSAGKPEWKVVLSSMICIAVTFLTRTILIWAKQYFPRALTSLRGQNMSGVFWKKLTPDHCVWWREKGREFRQVNESCAVLPHPGPENSSPFTSSIAVAANKNPKHVAEVYLLCSWPPYAFLGASPSQDLQDGHLEAAVKAVLQAVFYWNTWQKCAEGNKGYPGTCRSTHCHGGTGLQILNDDWKRNDSYLTDTLALVGGRGSDNK